MATYSTSSPASDLIGQNLRDVRAPSTVMDIALLRRNCQLMLETTKKLGVDFRAHVKTHKTVQLARLQVGEDSNDIRLLVSTVAELEHLMPWLLKSRGEGRAVNVLYGLPVTASSIPRLAKAASQLGSDSIAVIIDHPQQIKAADQHSAAWPDAVVPVFVKVDVGYHRAGVIKDTAQWRAVAEALTTAKNVHLKGFYAHAGHSYGVSSSQEALDSLVAELEGLYDGAQAFVTSMPGGSSCLRPTGKLVLTLGASPTATATQNATGDDESSIRFRERLNRIRDQFTVEIHAGVYPVLDMQQLATRARPKQSKSDKAIPLLAHASLALRVLVEVNSIYNDRNGGSEALVAAGSIVLGREPCKSYPGWAVVSAWPSGDLQVYDPEGDRTGWIVDRISQEHGVLRWHGSREHFWPVSYGQKLLVWPNHACMAGPNFDHYLIIDSDQADPDVVVDVWRRCRGW